MDAWQVAQFVAIVCTLSGDGTSMLAGESQRQESARSAAQSWGDAPPQAWSLGRMVVVVFVICLAVWAAVIAYFMQS